MSEVCAGLSMKTQKLYELVLHRRQQTEDLGWHLTKESQTSQGRRFLDAALFIATTVVHMETCTTIRIARECPTLGPLSGFTSAETWIWHSTLQGEDVDDPLRVYDAESGDLDKPFHAKDFINEEPLVRSGKTQWQD